MHSKPVRREARSDFRSSRACLREGRRHSRIKVLLPEPLTPVTRTRRPKGKLTVRFLRLFFAAPRSVSQLSEFGTPSTLDFPTSTALLAKEVGLWTLDF